LLQVVRIFISGALAVFVSAFMAGSALAFEIESAAFQSEQEIPVQYTCAGKDVSPPLHWKNPPAQTKSFVLIVDDPDASIGTWVHWVVYDIPETTDQLTEGLPKIEILPDESKQGITDFGVVGYGGPCPPPGKPHHYHFKLYALDALLQLPPKQTKAELLVAMQGHILAEAEWVGQYEKK